MQAETAETSETVPLRGISEATAAEILAFRDDRRWLPYHNPKDLAMSVAIEAGELLEVFQWSGTDLEPLKSSKAPTNYFTPNILRKSWSRLVVSVVHLDALAFPVAAT